MSKFNISVPEQLTLDQCTCLRMAINYEYDDSFDSFESGSESDVDVPEGDQLQSTSDTTLTGPKLDVPKQLEVQEQSRGVYFSLSDQEESHTK